MDDISDEPISPIPAIRHDGWTGEATAKFLETLAETGIVLEACDAPCKSSTACSLRRRHPLFVEAWEKALGIAAIGSSPRHQLHQLRFGKNPTTSRAGPSPR